MDKMVLLLPISPQQHYQPNMTQSSATGLWTVTFAGRSASIRPLAKKNMEIENSHLLCIVAWQQPDYLQCYRVDGILALRHLPPELARQMTGHPGNDLRLLPDGDKYAFAFRIRPAILRKVERWTTKGLFVAVYTIIHRDKAGQQRAYEYNLSWRRAEKYLTGEDLAWLNAYSESSFWYTDRLMAEAIGRVMAGIGQVGEQIVSRPKKKKNSQKCTRKR